LAESNGFSIIIGSYQLAKEISNDQDWTRAA